LFTEDNGTADDAIKLSILQGDIRGNGCKPEVSELPMTVGVVAQFYESGE